MSSSSFLLDVQVSKGQRVAPVGDEPSFGRSEDIIDATHSPALVPWP